MITFSNANHCLKKSRRLDQEVGHRFSTFGTQTDVQKGARRKGQALFFLTFDIREEIGPLFRTYLSTVAERMRRQKPQGDNAFWHDAG